MIAYIVLAAGQSVRMRSATPKIRHTIAGKPMIDWVLGAIQPLVNHTNTRHCEERSDAAIQKTKDKDWIASTSAKFRNDETWHKSITIVVSHQLAQAFPTYNTVVQTETLGTGHALLTGLSAISPEATEIIVVYGDMPLITTETLANVAASQAELTLTAFGIPKHDKQYGRIVFDDRGMPQKIVEYKDASDDEKKSIWGYPGILKIKRAHAEAVLQKLSRNNKASEFYLTDIVALLPEATKDVIYVNEAELIGINTRMDLARATQLMQQRLMAALMLEGVTFEAPDTTTVSHDTVIARDTVVAGHVHIGANVRIGSNVVIHPFTYLEHCVIEDGVHVGPFAHVRGDTVLMKDSCVGSFVELKKTRLGTRSKVKHLAYLGDATLGTDVNIGAGTITCNYNGVKDKKKHATVMDDNVSVGANTSLIAPLHLHKGCYVAAGSVITKDVPSGALAIERGPEKHVEGWVSRVK